MDNKNVLENEQLLNDMSNELEQKDKIIWTSMWVIIIIAAAFFLASVFIITHFITDEKVQIITILALLAIFLPSCFYALKLEVSVGHYECKNCGHKIVPTFSEALAAMHCGFTRRLKCPKCTKRTWCKKVIKK